MRIAMVGPFGLHPNKTMSSRAFGLARPLAQQEHEICIFMPPWQTPHEEDRRWRHDGVDFRYIPLSGSLIGITKQLLKEILAWEPDIVHCFKPKAYSGLVAWWLWQFHRKRLKLVVDTDDWEGWGGWNDRADYSLSQKKFFSWQEQWGMRHCHSLTAASRALQSIAWSQGIGEGKVSYIPNGSGLTPVSMPSKVEIAAQKQALGLKNRPVLLLYSRLFEFDTERLVKILAGVKKALPDLAILSIGTGLFAEDAVQLQDKLAEADILTSVIDLGWRDPKELPLFLSCADVGIFLMDDTLLNRTKCPVKLADLTAYGVPVVAEAVGQVSEYIENDLNGLLYSTGDTGGIIEGIISLLTNNPQRMRMADAAMEYYQANFSWDLLSNRLLHLYEQTLAENSRIDG